MRGPHDLKIGKRVTCPHCGKVHTDHMPVSAGPRPKKGDVSICITCGQASIFDRVPGWLRLPTDDEWRELEQTPELRRARSAWRKVVAQ